MGCHMGMSAQRAWYNTWLHIKVMPKGVVFAFLSFSVSTDNMAQQNTGCAAGMHERLALRR